MADHRVEPPSPRITEVGMRVYLSEMKEFSDKQDRGRLQTPSTTKSFVLKKKGEVSYDFREVYLFNLTYYDRRVLLFVAPEMSLAILRPRVKKKRLDKHTKINKQQLKRITIRGKGFQRSRRRSRPC